jgi:hypothetical protein
MPSYLHTYIPPGVGDKAVEVAERILDAAEAAGMNPSDIHRQAACEGLMMAVGVLVGDGVNPESLHRIEKHLIGVFKGVARATLKTRNAFELEMKRREPTRQ